MQRLHSLLGKQLTLSSRFVHQPCSQWKNFSNNNYLMRSNWFSTQKDLLNEQQPKKDEPVFEVDVNNQVYKLAEITKEFGHTSWDSGPEAGDKFRKSNLTNPAIDEDAKLSVQERLEDRSTIEYIAKKLPWHSTSPRLRKEHVFFKPDEIGLKSIQTDIETPQPRTLFKISKI
jgi:hypothetical protein